MQKKCAAILGIEIDNIYFSGFYSQGDGACFNGRFSYAKGWKKALKKYAPMDKELFHIGQALQVIQSPYFYNLSGAISCNDRYKTTKADFHWSDNVPEDVEDNINQVFSDFSAWIYKNLRAEYEWLMSEECLTEDARANDWRFDENGRIV